MTIPTHSPYIGREAKATAWLIHFGYVENQKCQLEKLSE